MLKEQVSQQSQSGYGMDGKPSPPSSLPDINAETYPFEVVQYLLDQAAYFNMFSIPEAERSNTAINAPDNPGGVIGIKVHEVLHRFGVTVRPPTLEMGLRAVNVVGEPVGTFKHRWLMIPHHLEASPHREPPPTLLEPSRSQRFVMLDGLCTFGDGKDGFHGFGTGLTFPMTVNGRPKLLAAAVGNILEGFGKFKGREGTYTHCGHIVPNRGFQGNLICRIMDPEGTLCTERELPPLTPMPDPEPGLTYILFHGQKRDKYSTTTYDYTSDGQMKGFHLTQEVRQLFLDFTDQFTIRDGGDLRARKEMGQVIGKMRSQVFLNLLDPQAPPGTALAPIPFSSYNEYTFFDREGYIVGSVAAQGGEGRTFTMKVAGAPGQQVLRFGAFQTLANGSGCFSGIQGLLADNSVVGVAPHATSTLYILCINDPDGQYRAR